MIVIHGNFYLPGTTNFKIQHDFKSYSFPNFFPFRASVSLWFNFFLATAAISAVSSNSNLLDQSGDSLILPEFGWVTKIIALHAYALPGNHLR